MVLLTSVPACALTLYTALQVGLAMFEETIASARGTALTAALEEATREVSFGNAEGWVAAVCDALASDRAGPANAEAFAAFFSAALQTVAAAKPEPPFTYRMVGLPLDRALSEVATEATRSLPVAKRMLELLNAGIAADPQLARAAGLGALRYFRFHTVSYDGDPIPLRSHGGVTSVDLVYAMLTISLTLSPADDDDDDDDEALWAFVMKLVAKFPTARGLPDRVKQLRKIARPQGWFPDLMVALLRAGLSNADPRISRVVTSDAVAQLERQAPAKKRLAELAEAAALSSAELTALDAFLSTQTRIGSELGTLASVWAVGTWAEGQDERGAAARLQATLRRLGMKDRAAAKPTPKHVLIALHEKRFDDVRALLKGGVRMEDPGCRPDGAIHLVQKSCAPDEVRFPLIELMFEHGLDVDDTGLGGGTALQLACYAGDLSMVRFLLEHGAWVDADMDTASGHNETSLHAAVGRGHETIVALLLEHGADPTLENWNGETALDVANDAAMKALLTKKYPAAAKRRSALEGKPAKKKTPVKRPTARKKR